MAACLTLTLLAPAVVRAETSEWQQRVAPGTKGTPKAPPKDVPGATTKSRVKSEALSPGTTPGMLLPGAATGPKPPARPSLGPSTTPNESEHAKSDGVSGNAAYEAFEQGKYLTALALAEKAAANGDPQSHTLVARIHADGLGVPQDFVKAAHWYGEGAKLGDIEASFALGALHAQGQGVEKNFAKAAELFEVAALKGHPLANYNLALLFLKGQGKAENPRRAFAHMLFAAERGVVSAQYDVGTLLTTGTGTEPNAFEGAKWIGKAARAGHVEAEIEYAIILFKVDADPNNKAEVEKQRAAQREGVALLRSAAEKGHPVAQNRLGRCYANGIGVEMNIIEAAKWHLIARSGGIDDDVLDKIIGRLSKTDRQRAEKTAEEWRERSLIQ